MRNFSLYFYLAYSANNIIILFVFCGYPVISFVAIQVWYKLQVGFPKLICGLGGLVVSTLDFQVGYPGFKSAWVKTIFRPLVYLAHTRRALG